MIHPLVSYIYVCCVLYGHVCRWFWAKTRAPKLSIVNDVTYPVTINWEDRSTHAKDKHVMTLLSVGDGGDGNGGGDGGGSGSSSGGGGRGWV